MREPNADSEQTYSQTEAARACGVTQRVLVDRGGRSGYLSKLHYCFPGEYFHLVVEGSIENQKKCRLTSKGVAELRNLIQAISPEPPSLDENRELQYNANGKVLKKKLPQPISSLEDYAEFIWESQNIDGAFEHSKEADPSPEVIEAAFLQEESFEDSNSSAITNTEELISGIFQMANEADKAFTAELSRRAQVGFQQGRMLAAVEIGGREKGEETIRKAWEKTVKNQSSRKLQ